MKLAGRSASLATAVIGAVSNFALAIYLLRLSRSPTWEPGSEWEGTRFSFPKDGAQIVCSLFSIYFSAACTICMFGLVGIIERIPSFVRIYRDYVIGDFAFYTLSSVLAVSAAVDPSARAQVCELVSRQPDLLRGVTDLGLTLENCEQWFERGLMAFMTVFLLRTVLRIHFIFALSRLNAHLASDHCCDSSCVHGDGDFTPLERIYLLPHPPLGQNEKRAFNHEAPLPSPIYAPVSLSEVSPQIAHQLRTTAKEAWISHVPLQYARTGNEDVFCGAQTSNFVGPINLDDERR